jgi:hypothetical protein
MRIKRFEDDKSAWHEEESTAQANISHSALQLTCPRDRTASQKTSWCHRAAF